MALTNFGHEAIAVAEHILNASKTPLTPMQLLKLVYISHGWMLGLYSRQLILEQAEAWQYGPVIPSVYHQFKKFGGNQITEVSPFSGNFDRFEEDVMRQVIDHYGNFSGVELSELTHKPGTPWDITRKLNGPGSPISNDLIEQHYKKLARGNAAGR